MVHSPPKLIIEAGRSKRQYWRDILVCYKQTIIGIARAFIRPCLISV